MPTCLTILPFWLGLRTLVSCIVRNFEIKTILFYRTLLLLSLMLAASGKLKMSVKWVAERVKWNHWRIYSSLLLLHMLYLFHFLIFFLIYLFLYENYIFLFSSVKVIHSWWPGWSLYIMTLSNGWFCVTFRVRVQGIYFTW